MESQMNLDRLREIIDLVEESSVSEIEIEENGLRIVVRKDSTYTAFAPQVVQPVAAGVAVAAADSETPSSQESEPQKPRGEEIRAPIVGTYYSAPSPDAEQFVSIGSTVKPGDVLCVIEAMKLMNEIECEVSGVVREMLVENASPVEFDQALFIIETR